MSDTEQLFIVAGVWTFIAGFIAYFIPSWWIRVPVFAVLVGVPFWELPYGYYNFLKFCQTETKVQVFEKIPPQEFICLDHFDPLQYGVLVKAGFTRIEIVGRSDNAKEYAASGKVFMVSRDDAKSSLCITSKINNALPWRLLRHDVLVTQIHGSGIVVKQSRINWLGMWWQHQMSPVLGRGGYCFSDPNEVLQVIRIGTN